MIRYSPESSGTEASESASESPRRVGLDLQLHLGNRAHTEVVGHARTFLDLVRQIGYREHVNIDGLVTVAGHIYFHEIKARWGGSLVYHEVGDRLLGHGYADHGLVSSALGTDPVPFEQLVSLIDESRLAFDPDTRTGVVPLAGNSDLGGGTESVVLGRDAAEVRDLKGRLSACIAVRARTEGA
nr:peptide ligase PGM1-related protein [Streptomyces sp. SID14515]